MDDFIIFIPAVLYAYTHTRLFGPLTFLIPEGCQESDQRYKETRALLPIPEY